MIRQFSSGRHTLASPLSRKVLQTGIESPSPQIRLRCYSLFVNANGTLSSLPLLSRSAFQTSAGAALQRNRSVLIGRRTLASDPQKKTAEPAKEAEKEADKIDPFEYKVEPYSPRTFEAPAKKKLSQKVKDEIQHYWVGTKLFGQELKLAWRLIKKWIGKENLRPDEKRHLRRAMGDLNRMVPFIALVLIPFAEFALPFLLKLFPGMLPSTYRTAKDKQADFARMRETSKEMKEYLRRSLVDKEHSKEFSGYMTKMRRGERLSNEEIVKVAAAFNNESTLEGLNKEQLKAMCGLLGLEGSMWQGPESMRKLLKRTINELQEEDRMIEDQGGPQMLPFERLKEVCRHRGINPERTQQQMLRKLGEWMELSLHSDIPISILILSRAFSSGTKRVPDDMFVTQDPTDLEATLSHLSHDVVEETRKKIEEEAQGPKTVQEKEDLLDDVKDELEDLSKEEQKKDGAPEGAVEGAASSPQLEEGKSEKAEELPPAVPAAGSASSTEAQEPVKEKGKESA